MISREELPDDPLEWKDIDVSFPRLTPDTEESSPSSRSDVFDYICRESADLDQAKQERLRFLRTAQVGDAQYWLWSYEEEDGELSYVALRSTADEERLGLSWAQGLSPELYLLADYHDMVYW